MRWPAWIRERVELTKRAHAVIRRQAACAHAFANFDRDIGPGVSLRTHACGLCGKVETDEYAVIAPEFLPTLRAIAEVLPDVKLGKLLPLIDEAGHVDRDRVPRDMTR